MLHTLSSNIADFLLSKNCFEKDNLNIYVYGTELIISSVISAVLVFVLSLITNNLLNGFFFYISFNTLRAYTGGLHCKTYLKCNITFVIVFLLCLVSQLYISNYLILTAMMCISFFAILILAPIENPNKPIIKSDKIKYKIISVLIYIVHLLSYAVLSKVFEINADMIIVTDFMTSILMLIGIINNRRCKV